VADTAPGRYRPTTTKAFHMALVAARDEFARGAAAKQSAEEVARIGYRAMLRGEAGVVAGWKNKLMTLMAGIVPATFLAEQHRTQAAPGCAKS
jgi:short-subunit dehydrogenase